MSYIFLRLGRKKFGRIDFRTITGQDSFNLEMELKRLRTNHCAKLGFNELIWPDDKTVIVLFVDGFFLF